MLTATYVAVNRSDIADVSMNSPDNVIGQFTVTGSRVRGLEARTQTAIIELRQSRVEHSLRIGRGFGVAGSLRVRDVDLSGAEIDVATERFDADELRATGTPDAPLYVKLNTKVTQITSSGMRNAIFDELSEVGQLNIS